MLLQTAYTPQLDRFRAALSALPSSLPSGSSVYNFQDWKPDPELLETYGAECSVLNAHLELVFGLRATTNLTIRERGPGIESLADLFGHYLTGDFPEQAIIAKWLEDLTSAAEALSSAHISKSKRVPKLSAAQKRSNEYLESVAEGTENRKRARTLADFKTEWRAKTLAKTEQNCNWKGGFDDLKDVTSEPTLYITGRRGIPIIKELVIQCVTSSTNETRWRCASPGCQESWASRQPRRLLSHATTECRYISSKLREEAAEVASTLSLGEQVEGMNAAEESQQPTALSQPSVRPIVSAEGRKATQIRFDFNLVNFISAAQLPPSAFDSPEFHTLVSEANINIAPKHSTYIASSQIPMESARIRRLDVKELKKCNNLTLSFDGGTAIRPLSFTTIHVTNPDTRRAYLPEGIEASGISHTGNYYFGEIDKVIQEIGPTRISGISCDSTGSTRVGRQSAHTAYPIIIVLPDSCHQIHNGVKDVFRLEYFTECKSFMQQLIRFFSKSTFAATHLKSTRLQMGILQGLDKPGKTRFGGWHYAAASVQRCLPAIERLVKTGVIEVKQDHQLHFIKNIVTYERFKTQVYQLEKLTKPFARAIKCLESGHSNPSDVFIFNLAIMSSLRQLFDNNESELSLPDNVIECVQKAASARYYNMVLAAGNEVYLTTFFLHPQYLNTDILRRNNTNPLSTSIIIRPRAVNTPSADDDDLRQMIPSFAKVGLYLKTLLCRELSAGTIAAAKDYPSDEAGVDSIVRVFKSQFATYARGRYPFTVPSPLPPTFDPLEYWKKLVLHSDANLLAPLAVKLFSLVPNSMAEERTVSCFTKLNTKDRSRQKVSTLVQMTRIRHHLLYKRDKSKLKRNPVLKFRDLSTTLFKQREPIGIDSPNGQVSDEILHDGWLAEDREESPADGSMTKDSEAESDNGGSDDEDDDPVAPEATAFNITGAYGIDLSNPALKDMLSDTPLAPVNRVDSPRRDNLSDSSSSVVRSSAKKDTSGVDLDEY